MNAQAETLRGLVEVLQAMVGGDGSEGSRAKAAGHRQKLAGAQPKVEGYQQSGGVSKLNIPLIHVRKAKAEVPKSAAEKAIPFETDGNSGHYQSF